MNTINTAVSANTTVFASKEDYLSFKAGWKLLANKKALTRIDAALRVLVLNQDAKASLAPTKNPVRIANGALLCSGGYHAMADLAYEARQAHQCLTRRSQGLTVPSPAFAARWEQYGISLELLASLADKAQAQARAFYEGK